MRLHTQRCAADGCMDRQVHKDGGFMDGCRSEKEIRWLLENKWLNWVYLLTGLQQVSMAHRLTRCSFGGAGFNYFVITRVCGMCSVEQLPFGSLGRQLPRGLRCLASAAQCKACFSLGNVGHVTAEVTNSLQVTNQCITLIFFCTL